MHERAALALDSGAVPAGGHYGAGARGQRVWLRDAVCHAGQSKCTSELDVCASGPIFWHIGGNANI